MDHGVMFNLLLGFIGFGLVSSAVYTINDIRDVEFDREHPEKKNRPIAAGNIGITQGYVFALAILLGGLGLSFWTDLNFGIICLSYFILNLLYSFGLKNIPLLDVFMIALGFEFRIYGGGFLAEVPISPWLSLMIFLLAMFLALAKRRSDLTISMMEGPTRKSVAGYNLEFLNTTLGVLASVLILAYIMYTQNHQLDSSKSEFQILTSVFVIFGILRYLQRSLVENKGGQPVLALLQDKVIIFCVVGWLLLNFWILY